MGTALTLMASLALATGGVTDEVERLLLQHRLEAAFELAEQAARDDRPEAINLLASFYQEGIHVPADLSRAARLLKRSADLGDAEAQWRLGVMVDSGLGVRASLETAVKLFRAAARQGNAKAHVSLGIMYSLGRGVRTDHKLALHHYQTAARMGDGHAFNEIGVVHLAGEGVRADAIEATAWFFVAMMMGDESGAENLAEMFTRLDERAIGRASLRAAQIAEEYQRGEPAGNAGIG